MADTIQQLLRTRSDDSTPAVKYEDRVWTWREHLADASASAAALIGIRGAKSTAKVSMRAELSRVEISGPAALVTAAESAADDLRNTGKITLVRESWTPPDSFAFGEAQLKPLRSGEALPWKLV